MAGTRALGATGIGIAPLVLGGNVFGIGAMDREASFAVLDGFVAGGGTMIDTADMYANYVRGGKGGESEPMIGDWLATRGARDRVRIMTKGGGPMDGERGLSRVHLERAIEASLRRLRTDRVDVYLAHMDDAGADQGETAEALDGLVRAGKVLALGASNFAPARLASAIEAAEARGLARYAVLQPNYNLMERDFERDMLPLCEATGIASLPYFALAQGYLTGKYRTAEDLSKSRRGRGVTDYMEGRGPAVLAALDAIAAVRGEPLAAIALAWLKARPGVTAPIASATSLAQLGEIMRSLAFDLDEGEVAALDAASG